MLFDADIPRETYALVRFGLGYPARGAPTDPEAMLSRLSGVDTWAEARPFLTFDAAREMAFAVRRGQATKRKTGDDAPLAEARKAARAAEGEILRDDLIRAVETDDPFRERLQDFWLNHFAARAKQGQIRPVYGSFVGEAIRPHLTGRFGDMLKAAVLHPLMLIYLDQPGSVGPGSPVGLKQGKGLNENLAREVLELHTLGVAAGYTQADVTQFAELLTGLSVNLKNGFRFLPNRAEPGAETVLGRAYGSAAPAALEDIHAALDDLARHPATGPHVCAKLARYFVADDPDPDLVTHMAQAYRDSDGQLMQVYAAMLGHPAAWARFGSKAKWPLDLVKTSLRAVGLRAEHLEALAPGRMRKAIAGPLTRMGQPYARVPSADGWGDRIEDWIHPHGMAARIGWGLGLTRRLPDRRMDPRHFVRAALGPAATKRLIFAAGAAETREVGIALVLASAEFNRR